MFGGGKDTLDSSGLVLSGDETSYYSYNGVRWMTEVDPPGGDEVGKIQTAIAYYDGHDYQPWMQLTVNGGNAYSASKLSLTAEASSFDYRATLDLVGKGAPTATLAVTYNSFAKAAIDLTSSSIITLSTDGAERLRIASDGKVGIGTSSPGQLLDVHGVGKFNGIELTTYNLYGHSFNLNDDAVQSWTPGSVNGVLVMASASGSTVCAVVHYQASSSYVFCVALAATGNIVTGTGALSAGTSGGTDGKVNINTHTDGKIYVKNRLGAAYNFKIVQLCG